MEGHRIYYNWIQVPNHFRTEKQILKRHRRLEKHAQPVGTITHIFDKPRCRPKYIEPVPPDECERLRQRFQHFGPDDSDQWALYRLDQAGQLVTSNLYNLDDTEPITALTLRYEASVDLAAAAAETGLRTEDFAERLRRSPTLSRSLGALQARSPTPGARRRAARACGGGGRAPSRRRSRTRRRRTSPQRR